MAASVCIIRNRMTQSYLANCSKRSNNLHEPLEGVVTFGCVPWWYHLHLGLCFIVLYYLSKTISKFCIAIERWKTVNSKISCSIQNGDELQK